MMTRHTPPPPQTPREPLWLLALKWCVYAVATFLYLRILATPQAAFTAAASIGVGIFAAEWAQRRKLRTWLVLAVAGALMGLGFGLGQWLLDTAWGPGVRLTLLIADSVFFGLLALGLVLGLRFLATRWRALSVLEAGYVVGAVAYTFAHHRHQAIHRPRWLSDWAWSSGIDPQVVLQGLGIAAVLAAVFVLLRAERVTKLIISLLALFAVGGLAYWLLEDARIESPVDTNGLGLTSGEGDEALARDGGGGADPHKDPFAGSSKPPDVVVPVAIATLHDDYTPSSGIFYFRQQVLSDYNGHRLVVASDEAYDRDVITEFPHDETLTAEPTQDPAFHVRVPASMFLLVDHPQPLALSSSIAVEPLENPNPRHFVAAYRATSMVYDSELSRLVGRRSVPESWSPEKRAHYLAIPDDPRYLALSDELVRDVDPRFEGDDLMKALVIKRYLEKEGFYTRKERHEDAEDPAGSFLFGSLRGYCVHFAHAAVFLLRSQGIAARVALGYAVDTQYRSGGSTIMILNDRAHAWPEIHLDGVGWVTFDVYPERSDEPPQKMVDQDLESVLGELARRDKTGGRAADPDAAPFHVPWAAIAFWIFALLGTVLAVAYLIKLVRALLGHAPAGARPDRRVLRACLDRLADVGLIRMHGETRERFASRLHGVAPSLTALTTIHLRAALGAPHAAPSRELRTLGAHIRREIRANLPWYQRALGAFNPIGWWFTH